MNIAVFGPGALGCLFAAKLAQAGHNVRLVDHRADRADRLRRSGITIETGEGTLTLPVPVKVEHAFPCELALVLVKSHATASLQLPPDCPVLTLQNGLGSAEALAKTVGPSRLLVGTTAEAATWLSEGRVRHAAPGITWLGAWTHCPHDSAIAALCSAGFDARHSSDPRESLWTKAIVNAAINPLTALLDVPNGALPENASSRGLLRALAEEAAAVAAAEGYGLGGGHAERAEQVCRDTAANISSMLQDIRAGRKTEIEAISGEVLRRARAAGLPVPATEVAYALVRALESRA
jgi:2-dehydropantoate 2-reductase